MKKEFTKEQLDELNKIILINGYLSKKEVWYFSKKFNFHIKLFRKRLLENMIPYENKFLISILNPFGIKIKNKTILLTEYLNLGSWRHNIFKNSKIYVSFKCSECGKDSKIQLRKIEKRKYYALEPICARCINKKVSQNDIWIKNTTNAQKICKNKKEWKEKHSIKMIEKWKEPGYAENISKKAKITQNKIEVKEKILKTIKEKYGESSTMHVDFIVDKIFKKSIRFKNYNLPSGKIIKIQGYEGFALDALLKKYKEEDIFVGRKKIKEQIGKIYYDYDNKNRLYYPDIYIKSENKIIEVKSVWTYKKNKEKNIAKKNACLNKGINFDFIIFNRKGDEIKEESIV